MSSKRKRQRQEPPPASAAEAAARLARIVDAAERAAESVIDDAEHEARRQVEEARDRADRLVAARLRELADELDPDGAAGPTARSEARERTEAGESGEAAELTDAPHLRPLEGGGEEPPPRRGAPAGARLLATQMAVSGASRIEIEQRLRSGFDLDDTNEILDAILGPEG